MYERMNNQPWSIRVSFASGTGRHPSYHDSEVLFLKISKTAWLVFLVVLENDSRGIILFSTKGLPLKPPSSLLNNFIFDTKLRSRNLRAFGINNNGFWSFRSAQIGNFASVCLYMTDVFRKALRKQASETEITDSWFIDYRFLKQIKL